MNKRPGIGARSTQSSWHNHTAALSSGKPAVASLAGPSQKGESQPSERKASQHTACLLPFSNCIEMLFACLEINRVFTLIQAMAQNRYGLFPHMTCGFHHFKIVDLTTWRTLDIIHSSVIL